MAASSDVAAFRAAGHSVASTASHFGISERAVYKACQAQAARLRRGVARVTSPSSAARLGSDAPPTYAPLDDALAGHCTYWRCPVTDEFVRVALGSRRLDWMNERRVLHARPSVVAVEVEPIAVVEVEEMGVDEPVIAPTPALTPAPMSVALQCDIAPTEPVGAAPSVVRIVRHNQRLSAVDWSPFLAWFAEYWRVPLALVAALVLIVLCM